MKLDDATSPRANDREFFDENPNPHLNHLLWSSEVFWSGYEASVKSAKIARIDFEQDRAESIRVVVLGEESRGVPVVPLELATRQWQPNVFRTSIQASALATMEARRVSTEVPAKQHLAVRLHVDPLAPASTGYYVSRTYRGLWLILLLVGLIWGLIGGFAVATGSLFSPSAVLMGTLGTIVLGLTLVAAGSRERIRRRQAR